MKNEEIALEYFKNGFNCAQSVLIAFKDNYNINEEDLLKISSGFGGGMGRLQETCGVVSGAYMVIGLRHGKYNKDDCEANEKTYELVREFSSRFKEIHGTTICRELLGCNLLTEEGQNYYKENNLRENVCIKCIKDSVKILNEMLK